MRYAVLFLLICLKITFFEELSHSVSRILQTHFAHLAPLLTHPPTHSPHMLTPVYPESLCETKENYTEGNIAVNNMYLSY